MQLKTMPARKLRKNQKIENKFSAADNPSQTPEEKQPTDNTRGYAIAFWVVFGLIGTIAATAYVVSTYYPLLDPPHARNAIFSIGIPLGILVASVGTWATKFVWFQRFSVVAFALGFIFLRLLQYWIS